jgi:hypothetical protein
MGEGSDGRAFDVVTGGDLKARYPEMQGLMPESQAAQPNTTAPKAKADPEPTGSIRQKAPRRVSAR